MTIRHLPESELQEYALKKGTDLNPDIEEHISHCETCSAKLANYNTLFFALQNEPKPLLDTNLSTIILSRLPQVRKAKVNNDLFIYGVPFAAIALFGGLVRLFQDDLFKTQEGSPALVTFTALLPVAIIIVWQCYDLLKKYQRQLKVLGE